MALVVKCKQTNAFTTERSKEIVFFLLFSKFLMVYEYMDTLHTDSAMVQGKVKSFSSCQNARDNSTIVDKIFSIAQH